MREEPGTARTDRGRTGAALFMAISLLALFSLLGASYIRFMSIELEESDMRVRQMRVRHYAAAGVHCVEGHIREALARGEAPGTDYSFNFAVYGQLQGVTVNKPQPLDVYQAEARVALDVIDEDAWDARFENGPAWPGENSAFRVVSAADIKRAGAARMQPIARHAVEAVLIAQNECCDIIYWGAYREDEDGSRR